VDLVQLELKDRKVLLVAKESQVRMAIQAEMVLGARAQLEVQDRKGQQGLREVKELQVQMVYKVLPELTEAQVDVVQMARRVLRETRVLLDLREHKDK